MGLGELMIFSPRKLLAVPLGGVLVAAEELTDFLDVPSSGSAWRGTTGWLIRRFAQRLLLFLGIPWHLLWAVQGRSVKPWTEPAFSPGQQCSCDWYAVRLLTGMTRQLEEVVQRRRQNYDQLLNWIKGLSHVQPLFPVLPDGVCPYAFPLLLAQGCGEAAARLQTAGVPASQWPDLPPEVLANHAEHKVALWMYEHLLLLPVHQSLTLKQMDLIGERLRAAHVGYS
jgi:hypothetical protein